ncbi:hypothetical protein ATCVGM07011_353L [Acanthocystis turfacea Chlorella virus GM0701.1]|nr:hypothetical protein ATCVGM07011_353L [Acanthocystis turfacea Chlorella virus GM0701.1]
MAGIFDSIKLLIMIGAYFCSFQLGKMAERPKAQWPRAKAGQNPWLVGDWDTYQKVFMGVVAVAILLTLIGPSGLGGFGIGRGGYGGGGFY